MKHPAPVCTIGGCDRPTHARGWCRLHYLRWFRHGDPMWCRPSAVKPICSVDGCDRLAHARGWCSTHYTRWTRFGTPEPPARPSAWERFVSRYEVVGDCWIWTATRDANGYGYFAPAKGRSRLAHRFAYEETVGPVPDGLELDHLCRNRACVNPGHLEPVTHAENVRRGEWQARALEWWQSRTHCPNGHPYTPENTVQTAKGHRACRICRRAKQKRQRDRQRERAA